tara:strand:+ start:547 stop:765 length:219 start_codon:yes stop_codon:yes gene_type:complete
MNENNNFKSVQDPVIVRLSELLEGMNIPEMRRDLNKVSNLRWLQRNLNANNEGDKLEAAHLLIRTLLRRGSK